MNLLVNEILQLIVTFCLSLALYEVLKRIIDSIKLWRKNIYPTFFAISGVFIELTIGTFVLYLLIKINIT